METLVFDNYQMCSVPLTISSYFYKMFSSHEPGSWIQGEVGQRKEGTHVAVMGSKVLCLINNMSGPLLRKSYSSYCVLRGFFQLVGFFPQKLPHLIAELIRSSLDSIYSLDIIHCVCFFLQKTVIHVC